MSDYEEQIRAGFSKLLDRALQELLGQKHLYQSVKIDLAPLLVWIEESFAEQSDRSRLQKVVSSFTNSSWALVDPEQWQRFHESKRSTGQQPFNCPAVKLPKFLRACPQCKNAKSPHKPGCEQGTPRALIQDASGKSRKGEVTQHWFLTYQCQSCDYEPLYLMIRRDGMVLSITGRNLFEAVDIPRSIPENVRKYYRECIIAKIAGKGLPAVLFLRVLIERHMRAITGLEDRLRGDELAEMYSKTLDPEFPSSARSFRETYDNLSAILHVGEEDAGVLETSLEFVRRHFDLLKSIPSPKGVAESQPVDEAGEAEEETSIYPN